MCAGLAGAASSCIPQYNAQPPFPTDAEVAAMPTLNYPSDSHDDRVAILSRNWPKESARCMRVQAAMQKEADAIDAKNKALGSIFIGLTAALAASSGLYASLNKNPDPTVTALLAFGASGTSIPSFFFLGSDDREKLVRSRMDGIDAKRSAFDDAWKRFEAADRNVATARNALAGVQAARKAVDCAAHADDCKAGDAAVDQASKTQQDAFAKWFAASDEVTQAADALNEACR